MPIGIYILEDSVDYSPLAEALRDLAENPWFGSAIAEYSLTELVEAGLRAPLEGIVKESRDHPVRFYDDDDDHPYVKFAANSHFDVEHARRHAAKGTATILVAMGSYAPMHIGHIAMMEAADRAVRNLGDEPIAATFSFHSEEHVKAKIRPTRPRAPISTDTRVARALEVCPDTLRSGTPTFLDTWDARMPGGPRSFTDIMIRIVRTLEASEIRGVTPVAVFGSDNGVSLRAFARWGQAVCVIRPGHEDDAAHYVAEPAMRKAFRERRVMVVERDDRTKISSSEIRSKERTLL